VGEYHSCTLSQPQYAACHPPPLLIVVVENVVSDDDSQPKSACEWSEQRGTDCVDVKDVRSGQGGAHNPEKGVEKGFQALDAR
jgi:hypothetical protein